MALINHAKREINAKIVYYGREGAGKRDSLQYIYDRIKSSLRGELKAPKSSGDALFFFDFSPFEKPVFGDFRIRFHVYTLPGKVINPAAWKMTLKGADGLVIVADSSLEAAPAVRENILELRDFLSSYGVGLQDIPCILQLDKRTARQGGAADVIAVELGLPTVPACFCDAATGEGVLDTLSRLSREIMARVGEDDALRIVETEEVLSPDDGDDTEVAAALGPLGAEPATMLDESNQLVKDQAVIPVSDSAVNTGQLQVTVAADGANYKDGVMKIPLEFTLDGVMRRLVVTIAVEVE
jgi:signal recognition particle receptor subunit beta